MTLAAEYRWNHVICRHPFRRNLPITDFVAIAGGAIYFIPQRDVVRDCYHLQRLDVATGPTVPVIDLKDIGGGLSVSADGRSLLYTTVVHTSGDLMLVENFR